MWRDLEPNMTSKSANVPEEWHQMGVAQNYQPIVGEFTIKHDDSWYHFDSQI